MGDMANLVRQTASPSYRISDQLAMVRLFVFNLLVAGVDAHAKNHSLLHVGNATRLAPAYDLISAHGIWSADRVAVKSSAAVKYGRERQYRKISGRNIARAADVLGVPRSLVTNSVSEMAALLPDAFGAAIAEVPASMVSAQLHAMPTRVRAFADEFVSRLSHEDLSVKALDRFAGATAVGRPTTGRVWRPGEWRRGRWVTGRYVSRVSG